MKAGIIGSVAGDFARIADFRKRRVEGDHELTDQVEVTGVMRTPGGLDVNEGQAARERLRTRRQVSLRNDRIVVDEDPAIETELTEFATIPGEVVVIGSKRGRFLFDLLGDDLGVDIERAAIDLSAFVDDAASISPWKIGFDSADGNADNGVLYGEDLLSGDASALIDGADVTQLGAELEIDGDTLNVSITASGYVEIYQPSSYGTADYLAFIDDHVRPHLD